MKTTLHTKQQAIDFLTYIAEKGNFFHVIETGEEWIGTGSEAQIFMGKGNSEDWKGLNIEEIEVPDGQGGTSLQKCYVQKQTEVANPVNQYEDWLDDFRILEVQDGAFFPEVKTPY